LTIDPFIYSVIFKDATCETILRIDSTDEVIDPINTNNNAEGKTLTVGDPFVFMADVTVKDDDGKGKDITKKVRLSGVINTNVPGKHIMHYSVKASKVEMGTLFIKILQ